MYQISLNLKGKSCGVIGGGRVALRKIRSLLREEARITVISPRALPEIQLLAEEGRLTWLAKEYEDSLLEDFFLVFCATDSVEINERAGKRARSLGALVNDGISPEKGDFFVPASIKRGDLEIAISTNGVSPAFSALIRQDLSKRYPEELGDFLGEIGEIRSSMKEENLTTAERQKLWHRLMTEDILELILKGSVAKAKDEIRRKIISSGIKP